MLLPAPALQAAHAFFEPVVADGEGEANVAFAVGWAAFRWGV